MSVGTTNRRLRSHVRMFAVRYSYGVAKLELLPDVEHRQSRYLNNRAENSHRPTRRRERQMQRFKSARQAQRFLSAHALIYGHFRPRRHRTTARNYRAARALAFKIWTEETCAQNATQPRHGCSLQPRHDHGPLS